jgi:hypothetical protein
MSQENVEVVRRCSESWTNRDFSAFGEVAHPDLIWDVSRRVFNPAVYHGLDGFRRFVEQVDEMGENLQFVPEEFIDAGDHVFTSIRLSGSGRGSGVQAEMREFAIWTFLRGALRFPPPSAALQLKHPISGTLQGFWGPRETRARPNQPRPGLAGHQPAERRRDPRCSCALQGQWPGSQHGAQPPAPRAPPNALQPRRPDPRAR